MKDDVEPKVPIFMKSGVGMADLLKEKIINAVEAKIAGSDIFLVEVKIGSGKIMVLIDKPSGITLTECSDLTRYLHEALSDVFERNELEVSSPGMEEPLKVLKQYQKRVGREVRVLMADGMVKKGILKAAGPESLELEEKIERKVDKKKIVEINHLQIPFNQIKETRVVFSFK